ncbi:hypothetical protein L9F63_014428, partial [Diploptera punctata]
VSTRDEPVPGWIDNVYGPTGVFVGAGVGFIKTLHCDASRIANIVPVDMAVNALIASAWEVGNKTRPENGDDIPIYNYVSSVQKPITWGEFMEKGSRHGIEVPTVRAGIRDWSGSARITHHSVLDLECGKSVHVNMPVQMENYGPFRIRVPGLVKIYKKINKFSDVISYFSTRDWKFTNDNVQLLWKKMDKGDRNLFDFNMDELDWEQYFHGYVRGVRIYLIKDELSTIPQAKIKYQRFVWIHQIMKYFLMFLIIRIVWSVGIT